MKRRMFFSRVGINTILVIISCIMVAPILLIINIALKTPEDFLKYPIALTSTFNYHNFVQAWLDAEMYLYFKNSVIFTLLISSTTILLGTIAAYPIARNHFKGSGMLYSVFLSGLFLPTSLVPIIVLMKALSFYNTYYGYVILMVSGGIPIAVFILTGFIKGLPRELDEAAVIDGCGYLRFVISIVFPLMKPAIATLGMLTAIGAWNDFINPYLFLTDRTMRPLTAGLYMFFGEFFNNWTVLCAGILIVALPLILGYVLVQQYIISGAMAGAIKG